MNDPLHNGLTRGELEYQLRWLLRRAPKDPARLAEFIGEVVITLIDKNNAAQARAAMVRDRSDLPEDF